MTATRWWQDELRDADLAAYKSMHRRQERGSRPALVCVDIVRSFVGESDHSLAEAIEVWP